MQVRNESWRVYHFPQLHDGCCFYDILSRFHEESGHFSSMATSVELFKSCPDLRSTVVLPYRAGLVEEWLGSSANITPEVIRDKHSAWQYLHLDGEFSDDELVPILQAQAKPGRRKQEKMRLAVQKQISSLRYCPQCIAADFLKEGEPFWHQVHQIFGVKYCPIHGIRLVESDVSLAKRLQQYVPASSLLVSSSLEGMVNMATFLFEEESPFKERYLGLARTIDRLLTDGLEFIKIDHSTRYRKALGVSSENIEDEGEKLAEYLLSMFGRNFLDDLFPNGVADVFLENVKKLGIRRMTSLCHALIITTLEESDVQA